MKSKIWKNWGQTKTVPRVSGWYGGIVLLLWIVLGRGTETIKGVTAHLTTPLLSFKNRDQFFFSITEEIRRLESISVEKKILWLGNAYRWGVKAGWNCKSLWGLFVAWKSEHLICWTAPSLSSGSSLYLILVSKRGKVNMGLCAFRMLQGRSMRAIASDVPLM